MRTNPYIKKNYTSTDAGERFDRLRLKIALAAVSGDDGILAASLNKFVLLQELLEDAESHPELKPVVGQVLGASR